MAIRECIEAYDELIGVKYVFTVGRKNVEKDIVIHFNKSDFKHLVGLHYLTDIRSLHGSSEDIYDNIKNGVVSYSILENSTHYSEIESNRIALFPAIKSLIENNKLIFRFNKSQSAYTRIKYEYVMEFEGENDTSYLFLNKSRKEGEYSGVSFFKKEGRDYTKGQTRWTVLKIKRMTDDKEELIYKKSNYIEK